ncbi:MAG: TonB-dependent receptor [Gammaproteobacteria bacterium]
MRGNLRKRRVTLAVRAALASALMSGAASTIMTPEVFAQQALSATTHSAPSIAQLGKVMVSGEAVPKPAPTSLKPLGPIQIITNQQIQATGLTSVADILSRLTIFGNGINTTANFGANGESCINLRSLGCNRVLVLVNGKRWPSLITGEVDMNTIPVAIIDHIEILKSGASAEYGSGAMTGVVNIVTKANFNGTEASAYFGQYQDGGERDGNTSMYEFTHGTTTEKSSSIFNASFTDQQPITKGERAITEFPNPGTGVTRGSGVPLQGIYEFLPPSTSPLYSNGMCPPNGQGVPFCDLTIIPGTPGTSISDYRPFNASTDSYNTSTVNYLQTPQKRTGLYDQGTYQFNDHISGHYTALYNDRRSQQQGGPAEATVGTQGNVQDNIPADQPYNPFGFALNSTGPDANLVLLGNQPVETGLRYWNEDSQTFYLNVGLDGDFDLGSHPFSWSVDGTDNRNTMSTTDGPEINLQRWALALGGPSECGPGSPNPTCVPLNMFGGPSYNGGAITPAMWNYVSYTASSYLQTDEKDWSAHISTPIVQLPAGPLQGTLQYDYQNDSGQFTPDALAAIGDSTLGTSPGANSGPPISGGYHMNAGSLIFKVPILADVPGAKFLSLDAATRYSNYNIFGSNRSSLGALHWTVNDQLAFRASWSQDFNAPTIEELFSAQVPGSTSVVDPCSNYQTTGGVVAANCAAAGVPTNYSQLNVPVTTTSGANPNLQVETSTSRTVGATWQVSQSVPLTFTADYFKIEIDNAIGSLTPQNILSGCYVSGASNLCSLITRNASGAIINLDTGNVNLGTLLTEGLDFDTNYVLTTQSAGTFNFDWMTTWVKLYTQTTPNFSNPSQPIIQQLINEQVKGAGYPRFKSFLTANWSYGGWQLQWQLQYIGNLLEACSDKYDNTALSFTNLGLCSYPNYQNNALSTNKIGAATFNNFQASYNLDGTGTKLIFGVNNIFDKEPPISHISGGYNTTLYPIPGRFPYISISQTF